MVSIDKMAFYNDSIFTFIMCSIAVWIGGIYYAITTFQSYFMTLLASAFCGWMIAIGLCIGQALDEANDQ